MKAARERGDIAYLKYDKLIVHLPIQNPPKQRKASVQSLAHILGKSWPNG